MARPVAVVGGPPCTICRQFCVGSYFKCHHCAQQRRDYFLCAACHSRIPAKKTGGLFNYKGIVSGLSKDLAEVSRVVDGSGSHDTWHDFHRIDPIVYAQPVNQTPVAKPILPQVAQSPHSPYPALPQEHGYGNPNSPPLGYAPNPGYGNPHYAAASQYGSLMPVNSPPSTYAPSAPPAQNNAYPSTYEPPPQAFSPQLGYAPPQQGYPPPGYSSSPQGHHVSASAPMYGPPKPL